MTDFLKRFWAVAVSLAGVAGLYLGALQVNLVEVFWVVLAASVLIAIASLGWKPAFRAVDRARNYPKILKRAATLELKVEGLLADLDSKTSEVNRSFQRGLREGRQQIFGLYFSLQAEPPRIELLGDLEGVFVLIAKFEEQAPIIHARFDVTGSATGEKRGAVQVVHVDEEKSYAYLKCVEPISVEFWEHLMQRASFDASPPVGVELTRYSVPELEPMTAAELSVVTNGSGVKDGSDIR